MQRWLGTKSWSLLLASLGLISFLAVSIGLRELAFRPGRSLRSSESAEVQRAVAETFEQLQEVRWWEQLILWGLLSLIVLLAGMLMTPEGRRRLFRTFIRLAAAFWAIFFIMQNNAELLGQLTLGMQAPDGLAAFAGGETPPVFEAPQISPWLIAAVSLGLAVALVFALLAARRWWARRQALLSLRHPLDAIADIARDSLADLSGGRALEDVILDCYARMARVVEQRRGLFRPEGTTPSEFAARLEQAGLPGDAVRGLTGLFERVRYGAHPTTSAQKDQAVSCLNTILRSCWESA